MNASLENLPLLQLVLAQIMVRPKHVKGQRPTSTSLSAGMNVASVRRDAVIWRPGNGGAPLRTPNRLKHAEDLGASGLEPRRQQQMHAQLIESFIAREPASDRRGA